MSSSTLDLTGEEQASTTLGHGTKALGPSDSSDSGSDVTGGPGMDEGLDDDQSREMPETVRLGAGRDLGDFELDGDSDRSGTGERASSGVEPGGANDQSLTVHAGLADAAADLADLPLTHLEEVARSDATTDDDDEAEEDDLDDVPASDGAT